jgi:ferric-dicitrate binding protein FerR (iron transport regulator)
MSVPCEEIRSELEGLLAAMTEGGLDPAGRRRLAEILWEHPEARQVYLDTCQMHALLTSAHGVLQALRPPAAGRRRRVLGWAAAILVAAGAALWWRPAGPGASLGARASAAEGVAWVARGGGRAALSEARDVRDGDRLVTGAASRTEIRIDDGSTLFLLERTEAEFRKWGDGRRVELREGTLHCQVAAQPAGRPLVFSTAHAEASVLGTEFELSADRDGTMLRAWSGRVRLSREGRSVDVGGGEIGTADERGLVRWVPVCSIPFSGLKALPPSMETFFCFSDVLLTAERKIVPAPERVHFVEGGLVVGPAKPARNGLIEVRWKEEVGEDVIVEADVAAGPPWSLGFAVSGSSFEGYRIIFAALDGYPNGVAVDTIHPVECTVLARDPRPISYDRPHTLRVERRGKRMRAWVDRELRIDTEVDHPLPEGRRKTFSLSNFGAHPQVRALRAWRPN